jgi:hypothetical protein
MGRWLVTSVLLMTAVIEVGTALAANTANDTLLTLAPNEQAEILGHAAGCTGNYAFYRGTSTDPGLGQGVPFWAVRCSDGKAYMVGIEPSRTRVLRCEAVKLVANDDCFTKFPGQ